jgi:hypothetical protein
LHGRRLLPLRRRGGAERPDIGNRSILPGRWLFSGVQYDRRERV